MKLRYLIPLIAVAIFLALPFVFIAFAWWLNFVFDILAIATGVE